MSERHNAEKLLDLCKAAEKNVRVNPKAAVEQARSAIEYLCKGLIYKNGVEQIREDGETNIATLVATCLENGFFRNADAAHHVRKQGGKITHVDRKNNYIPITEKNIRTAMESVRSLYLVMQEAFCYEGSQYTFNEMIVPFGDYEIDRAVKKSECEIVFGEYNYFVHNNSGDCYYLQIFERNEDSSVAEQLRERNNLVKSRIKSDKRRRTYLLETIVPYECPEGSDRDYIAYGVYEDSILLSESCTPMTSKQAAQVGIDLIKAIKEMNKIASGIHHRNIQPGCVMITPNEDTFMAGLVNMETAKVTDYEYTVFASIKGILQRNIYMPRELRNFKEGDQDIDWGKVDLYSIAKVIIYCLDPTLVTEEIDTDALYDVQDLSDDLIEAFRVIFESSINEIYSLDEFEEILENELA